MGREGIDKSLESLCEMIKLTTFFLDKINQGKADLFLRFDPSLHAALMGVVTGREQEAEAVAPGRKRTTG